MQQINILGKSIAVAQVLGKRQNQFGIVVKGFCQFRSFFEQSCHAAHHIFRVFYDVEHGYAFVWLKSVIYRNDIASVIFNGIPHTIGKFFDDGTVTLFRHGFRA